MKDILDLLYIFSHCSSPKQNNATACRNRTINTHMGTKHVNMHTSPTSLVCEEDKRVHAMLLCGQDYHRIWPADLEEVMCEAQAAPPTPECLTSLESVQRRHDWPRSTKQQLGPRKRPEGGQIIHSDRLIISRDNRFLSTACLCLIRFIWRFEVFLDIPLICFGIYTTQIH